MAPRQPGAIAARNLASSRTAIGSGRWHIFLALALGVVLFSSTIATLPQVILFWQTGVRGGLEGGGIGFRIFREGSWAATVLLFAWALLIRKLQPHGRSTAILAASLLFLLSLSVVAWSTVAKDVNVLIQLLGLRLLTYVPAIWMGYILMKSSPERSMRVLDKILRVFLAIQFSISIIQNIVGAGALKNARDLLGVRTFGTFANVNQFSAVMIASAILILATAHVRSKRKTLLWLAGCAIFALMSGSRTGTVTTLFLLSYTWLEGMQIGPTIRILAYALSPVLVISAVFYFGAEAFTGREDVDPLENNRIVIWTWVADTVENPGELLFGDGLGYGTASYVMLGNAGLIEMDREERRYVVDIGDVLTGNTHSTYLTLFVNFGIGSLLLFGWLLLGVWSSKHRYQRVIVVGVLLVSVPKSLIESFPAIFITFLALGIVLAAPAIQQSTLGGKRKHAAPPRSHSGLGALQLGH